METTPERIADELRKRGFVVDAFENHYDGGNLQVMIWGTPEQYDALLSSTDVDAANERLKELVAEWEDVLDSIANGGTDSPIAEGVVDEADRWRSIAWRYKSAAYKALKDAEGRK